MILAFKICMLVLSCIFFLNVSNKKPENQNWLYLIGGTITAALVLVAHVLFL